MLYYVYCEYIKTGKKDFINSYSTAQEAIEKIASCYRIDRNICQLGDYYYFMANR